LYCFGDEFKLPIELAALPPNLLLPNEDPLDNPVDLDPLELPNFVILDTPPPLVFEPPNWLFLEFEAPEVALDPPVKEFPFVLDPPN